ncbi:hypothetical protein A245_30146, partial [Pseudomonas syringae pv. actinidiae ICMP 19096]
MRSGLVEPFMLQRAADQNMAIAARDCVAPFGQDHARQEVRRTFVEDHLPFHRLDRQRQAEGFEQ